MLWTKKSKLEDILTDEPTDSNLSLVVRKILAGKSGIDLVDHEGENKYFMYTPIKSLGWNLVMNVSATEINEPLKKLAGTSMVIILFAAIILILAVMYITGSISKPLNNITSMVHEYSERGNLTEHIDIKS